MPMRGGRHSRRAWEGATDGEESNLKFEDEVLLFLQ